MPSPTITERTAMPPRTIVSDLWFICRLPRTSWWLTAAAVLLALAPAVVAQDTRSPDADDKRPSIERRVDLFIERLEQRRAELRVVGAAVVVAQRDQIVRISGLGVRSLDLGEAVTDETVFAVGSVTKQFTAMSIALAVSEGKLAFEDHPRKYVPAFHLRDPDADANINLIDLLTHRSGLGRSDLTWVLAPFTQAELIELAYRSQPAAKLRERFLYNNSMYMVAGAAVAAAYGMTYERLLTERLLAPLGMRSSTATFAGLTASANRAVGYDHTAAAAAKPAKLLNLDSIAPAGALNTTARDMGAWLIFLNSRGQSNNGPRIVPASFARIFEAQQAIGRDLAYGLGFFLETRSGVLIAHHGGNVHGYTAEVVHLPERALSFALLTNQDSSALGAVARDLFWDTVVKPDLPTATPPQQKPEAGTPPAPIASELLVGEYFGPAGAAFAVKKEGGDLVAVFAGQPPYPLKATGADAYDLTGLSGFSLTFAASAAMPGRFTAFLRQPLSHPGGNITYLKKDDAWLARVKAQYAGLEQELIGSYRSDDRRMQMEIVPYRGGVALIIAGQAPWPLVNVGADLFRLEGLPETYRIAVTRPSGGRAVGFVLQQPNLRLEMSIAEPSTANDTVSAKAIASDLLVGEYFATVGATFTVKKEGDDLVAMFAGQPPYPLKSMDLDTYDLTGLSGFSLRFAASTAMPGRFTAFLRQPPSHPAGNLVYLKKDDAWLANAKARYPGPDRELIGSYRSDDQTVLMEIVPYRGGVALIITGQPPSSLVNVGADLFRLNGFPETYRVAVKRSGSERVVGFVLEQPALRVEMSIAEPRSAGNTDEARTILERAVAAAGGSEVLDRLVSRTALGRARAPEHGIEGSVEDRVQAGNHAALIELGAFGKTVVKVRELTNDQRSVTILSDGDPSVLAGKEREAARVFAVPHPLHRWKERFVKAAAVGETTVNGQSAFVIELTSQGLAPARLYISAESFLILREENPLYRRDELVSAEIGVDYSDYRLVDGVRTPFALAITLPILGRITATYDSVSYDTPIDPAVFDTP
jgi:CubicO group peptidase (beta-lactamase class C family)